MSSTNCKRKRRTNNSPTPTAKRKKQNICNGCMFTFSSKEELLSHKVNATDGSDCKSDLYTCCHCKNSFLTSFGLTVHESKSVLCMRAKILPDIVNTIEFGPSNQSFDDDDDDDPNEDSHNLSTDNPTINDNGDDSNTDQGHQRTLQIDDININIVRNYGKDFHPPIISTTRSLLNIDLTKKTLKKAPCPIMRESMINFKIVCEEQKKVMSIDIEEISQSRTLSSKDYQIIDCFRNTSFNSPDHKASLFDALQEFWNNCYLVPSMIEPGSTPVMEEDVIRFLELYSTFPEENIMDIEDNNDDSFVMNEETDSENVQIQNVPLNETIPNNNSVIEEAGFQSQNTFHGFNGNIALDLKHFQKAILDARENVTFNNSDIAKLELYTMLSKANSPKYLFEDIQRWAIRSSPNLIGSLPSRRNTFIKEIGNKVYGEDVFELMKPKITNLVLPRGATIPVVTFSIKGAITSLLTNTDLMNAENLLINSTIPFQTSEVSKILSDINTGWWHHQTRDLFCAKDTDILLPIILFIDGSNVDKNYRLSVEPVTLTLGIFNRSTRNLSAAWRTIGFVENMVNKSSDDVKPSKHPSAKLQEYHAVLDHILSELKYIQGKDSGFSWTLTLDNYTHDVVFKVAVQVIIGDCKGNDSLCGRFGSHSKTSRGFCRDCKVTFSESDNPNHNCVFIEKSDIFGKPKEVLNSIGFHKISNAFDSIDFGAHSFGVYGATPSEPLHAFKLGLCKYLFECFMEEVPPQTNKLMDKRLHQIITEETLSRYGDLPSITVLRNGLQGFPTMTADDQFSRIFGILLCLMHPTILESFASDNRYQRDERKGHPVSVGSMGEKAAFDFFDLVEETVIYYSWLYSEHHDVKDLVNDSEYSEYLKSGRNIRYNDDSLSYNNISTKKGASKNRLESRSQRSVRRYLSKYKDVAQRSTGNQFKIVKFHQQLHNTGEILKDGSLLNIDGGRCESIAIANLKKPGSLSQKRIKSLNSQIANNLLCDQIVEDATMLLGKCTISGNESRNQIQRRSGSKFTIRLHKPNSCFQVDLNNIPILVQWKGKEYRDLHEKNLCNAVARRLFANIDEGGCLHKSSVVEGFTEYHLDNDNLLRAHPCYRGERPWFDWALIEWEGITEYVPAKLCMFLDLSNCQLMNDEEHNEFKSMFNDNENHSSDDEEIRSHTYQYLTRSKWVVIQSCITKAEEGVRPKNEYRRQSNVIARYYLEKKWRILPIESIICPASCIHVLDDDVIHIHEKSEWKKEFLK